MLLISFAVEPGDQTRKDGKRLVIIGRRMLVNLRRPLTALTAAVLAAYFKHDYKMWDVKSGAIAWSNIGEAKKRQTRAEDSLKAMRWAMRASVTTFALAIGGLLASLWVHFLR